MNEELLMVQDLRNGSLYINSVTLAHAGPYHCYLSENSETEKFILTVIENEEDNTGLQCGGGKYTHTHTHLLLPEGTLISNILSPSLPPLSS